MFVNCDGVIVRTPLSVMLKYLLAFPWPCSFEVYEADKGVFHLIILLQVNLWAKVWLGTAAVSLLVYNQSHNQGA